MVNRGASQGCLTCRERRVKCDEGKPSCNNCTTRGVECQGYGKKLKNIRFKMQKIKSQVDDKTFSSDLSRTVSPTGVRPSENEETLAFNFFINSFALNGRSLASSRGLFESIPPIVAASAPSSTISITVSAVSALFLNRWTRSSSVLDLSRVRLGQALQLLQTDLRDSDKRSNDSTLLSILMLQCYESTRAVVGQEKADRVHQDGAISLIKSLELSKFESHHAKRLLLYVLNSEVSSAIRESRAVDSDLAMWIENVSDMPWSPSGQLDKLGVRIAALQVRFSQSDAVSVCTPKSQSPDSVQNLYVEVQVLLDALVSWTKGISHDWYPASFEALQQPDPPVQMYLNRFDIYPNIQIASIWNTWRLCTLILLNMQLHVGQLLDTDQQSVSARVQELIDSICYSVPFCVGNRSKPSAYEVDPYSSIVFPSYYTLHLFGHSNSHLDLPQETATREDTVNAAKAQGAWQILPHLSQVVAIFQKPENEALRSCLREGQMFWLQKQQSRVCGLFGR